MSIPVIHRNLQVLIDKVDGEIKSRTQYNSARSSKWQNGDAGKEYQYVTRNLQDALKRLKDANIHIEHTDQYEGYE